MARRRQVRNVCREDHYKRSPVGIRVAEVAAHQHDIFTTAELCALGVARDRVGRWARSGRLTRLYRGVYVYGSAALTRQGRWLAAVRACGPGALLSHRSAACLRGLSDVDPVVIDVTVPRKRRGHDGVRLHVSATLEDADHDEEEGIPCTSPERTWLDLAAFLGSDRLKRLLSRGEREGILDPAALRAGLVGRRGLAGRRMARQILGAYLPAPAGRGFRSDLERAFWEAWVAGGHELPEVNAWACGFEVDMVWRRRRLAVELDGGPYHRTGLDRERDRAREQALRGGGFELLRFSDVELEADLGAVIATVTAALARRRARASRRRAT